ncbi:MAG: hypothetical protein O8C66_06125 [Candidatus Methanoperedens sp.]|nr:hypothetical protein [Candidatus Methanoperedens sp.]MCZ7370068.1 hypothetical protein [Candidatus Methanoperedens sp.]
MRTKRWLFLLILLSTTLIIHAHAARVYGTIYEWSDFEKPFKNTIVELLDNSTRVQVNVSTTGMYSFDRLAPGNYTIKARYFHNNILEYEGEENLLITGTDVSEDFNIDLLLFPPIDSEYEYLGDMNLTSDLDRKSGSNTYTYIIIIVILIGSALSIFFWIRKKRHGERIVHEPGAQLAEKSIETKKIDLPEDLSNIYDTIIKMGGRTTQKELRKKSAFSEAKVSLMLDDLESRGLVKKIRKGRSNIILAENQK